MADTFKIEVPLGDVGSGGSGSTKGNKEINKNLKKLDKTMYLNIDVLEILSSLLGDAYKILQPLFRVLSLLFMVIFLPLMPLIKALSQGIANWIKELMPLIKKMMKFFEKIFGEDQSVGLKIGKILLGILLLIITIAFAPLTVALAAIVFVLIFFKDEIVWVLAKIVEGFIWFGEKIAEISIWIWNIIVEGFSFISEIGLWIWEQIIKPAFEFLADVGLWIWEQIIEPAFSFLSNVGQWIWDIIKAGLNSVSSLGKNIWNTIKGWFSGSTTSVTDAIVKPNGQVIKTSPTDTIFAMKEPGKIGSSSSNVSININNPSVRSDSDIKKIANEVSKVMRSQLNNRFSSK